ncbi:MAG TPA: BMC domain-containing protein [Pirellulaceae bacterium]|nr:BMC domain-containing protein [Pirellulaceae bacterium]
MASSRSTRKPETASYTGHVGQVSNLSQQLFGQVGNLSHKRVNDSLGILEVFGLTPAMVALDQMDKTAGIRLHQAELNDFLGIVLKITGPQAAVKAAMAAGEETARQMNGRPVATVINKPDARAMKALESPVEISPLIQQSIVKNPSYEDPAKSENSPMADNASFALGFIETQGFTAVFEAIDSACKAANVEVIGKEKLGGGYITVVIKGDVAAVKAAIESGVSKVGSLGKLIAGHVIARPSPAVLALLPKA